MRHWTNLQRDCVPYRSAFVVGSSRELRAIATPVAVPARIIHESAAPTVDMTLLPGVLGP
jgi:hypothetical protein